jgi:micrococcal nuclease
MKKQIFILLAVLLLALTGCEKEPEEIDTTLYTNYTDALEIDFTYEGKDFIVHGVGEVTLDRCTDGDTAQFTNGSVYFSVRFLGIDTPESTYRIDPWGKAASTYTCDKLTNAETIVLEAQEERTDSNGRYLAWVWYDGRLLNLELIEQAYSNAKGASDAKYKDEIYDAELATQVTNRRLWGEDDPNYDYSLDGIQVSIQELATNSELYEGTKLVVQGFVAAKDGKHPYLIDENGYGIYIYLGFSNSYDIEIGNEILLEGLNLSFYTDESGTETTQLVGFMKTRTELVSEGNVLKSRELLISNLTTDDYSSYVTLKDLTVTFVSLASTGFYTITCEDALGNTIELYLTGSFEQAEVYAKLSVDSVIDVTGPLGQHLGQYQLELSDLDTVVKK